MIQLPILGAFLEAAGTILEKKVLRSRKMNFKNYTVYEFLAIVLVMLSFIWFFWSIKAEAFLWKNILIFAFVVIISVAANLLIFYSLKREKVTEFEPIWLMQPLFTILLAFILFRSERNWMIFGLALVASMTLVWSHWKKNHVVVDRYMIAVLFGSFLFAVELVASKYILDFYSPFTFYFLRCIFILIITLFLFRPKFNDISGKNGWLILLVGLMWAVYRGIVYYGYDTLGIIYTTIIFILSPVFLFLMAVLFLKEKPGWKQIASTIVILLCVALSVYLEGVK